MHTFSVSFFVHDGARRFAWEIQKVLAFYPVLMIMCLAVMIVRFSFILLLGELVVEVSFSAVFPLWQRSRIPG
jgi:hypothetical protein